MVETRPAAEPRRGALSRFTGLFTRRISGKIILPYIVVIAILAAGGTFIVVRLVAGSLDERLINQLVDAGRKANDVLVSMEDEHLRVFRTIAFTEGVDTALGRRDAPYLDRVIGPIQVNNQITYVDVLDASGTPVLSTKLTEGGVEAIPPEPGMARWPIVSRVLNRETDGLGDKFAALMPTSRGYILYTAGPVQDPDGRLQGVALVGSSEHEVVGKLNREALAAVTLYDVGGGLIATTLPYTRLGDGLGIGDERYQQLRELTVQRGTVLRRKLGIGEREYDEMIGLLEVRRVPAAAMGVAVPSEYIQQKQLLSRDQLIGLFTAAVAAVLVMGLVLARRITAPMLRLVAANSRVSQGELDVEVPPTTEDETGVLTRSFNEMVAGLRERERVKDTFGKYMSRDVTDYLLSHDITLGGEAREITIIMSDIRGFTTISEGMHPTDLVAFLNRYLSNQVACVLRNHGRVDKYMGDAILASFGAPVPRPNHAEDAIRAAIEMREALVDLNLALAADGKETVRIGIGVNSGTVVIGNIGSEERLEYTIIGDAVNTTQRTEDLTKEFATDILITEATYELVKDLIEVAEPHGITIRGQTRVTHLYPVIGLRSGVPPRAVDALVSASSDGIGAGSHGGAPGARSISALAAGRQGTEFVA